MGKISAEENAMRQGVESGRLLPGQRLPAPPDLSEAEAAEWFKVAGSMPPGWFCAEHEATLRDYCRHTLIAKGLGEKAARLTQEAMTLPEDDPKSLALPRVLAEYRAESRVLMALSRTLRLTKQSQAQPTTAHRALKRSSAQVLKPWESWGQGAATLANKPPDA